MVRGGAPQVRNVGHALRGRCGIDETLLQAYVGIELYMFLLSLAGCWIGQIADEIVGIRLVPSLLRALVILLVKKSIAGPDGRRIGKALMLSRGPLALNVIGRHDIVMIDRLLSIRRKVIIHLILRTSLRLL